MKRKKLMAAFLAGAMVLSVVACGSNGGEQPQDPGTDQENGEQQQQETEQKTPDPIPEAGESNVKSDETLVVALSSEPATLWTMGTGQQDNSGLIIQNCIIDRLVSYNYETQEVEPCLATGWEWLDDKRLQFTLRDDVTMSDGTPLEAADVVYTMQLAAEYSSAIDCGRYVDVDTTEAVDEHTVIVGVNVVAPDYLIMLAEVPFGIVTETEVEAAGGHEAAIRNPKIGTGRYVFKEWQSGQSITLERNENYWDKDYNGYYKEIKFTFTNDAAAREMAVESGDAGIALEIPVNIAASFEASDAVQTMVYPTEQVQHLFFNCREGACTDPKVREAISYAIDLNALVQVATAGYGEISNGWFCPGGMYYTDVWAGEDRSVNVEKAKELLAEAGYADGLSLKTATRQATTSVLTVIQENLRAIGVDLTVDTLDTAQYVETAKAGNYDIIMVGSNVESRKPTIFTFYQEGQDQTVIGGSKYTTPELSGKITQMVEMADLDQAKTMAAEIIQEIKDNRYAIDLYTEYQASIMANGLGGFKTVERGWVDIPSLYKVQ